MEEFVESNQIILVLILISLSLSYNHIDLVGPGGAVLRQLEDRFNVSLDLSQEGQCLIFGPLSSVSKAKNVIMDLVSDVEEGGVYEGTVIEIKDFGAVIEVNSVYESLGRCSNRTNL